MSKHTPGPWTARKAPGGWPLQIVREAEATRGTDFKLIAELGPWDRRTEKANARLIAAAPDLLEAAEEFLECVRHLVNNVGKQLQWDSRARLRAAIEKATGAR